MVDMANPPKSFPKKPPAGAPGYSSRNVPPGAVDRALKGEKPAAEAKPDDDGEPLAGHLATADALKELANAKLAELMQRIREVAPVGTRVPKAEPLVRAAVQHLDAAAEANAALQRVDDEDHAKGASAWAVAEQHLSAAEKALEQARLYMPDPGARLPTEPPVNSTLSWARRTLEAPMRPPS